MTSGRYSENLLTSLHRWASGQDENFITEGLAHLICRLLDNDPIVGVEFVRRLTGGKINIADADAASSRVSTQVSLVLGRPDLEIRNGHQLAFVEVKVESGLGNRQIERYLAELDKNTDCADKTLVLLCRYSTEVSPDVSSRVVKRRWFEIADWLRELRVGIEEPISSFLADQFIEFLKTRGITMEKVGPELVLGIRSLHSLLMMIEETLNWTKTAYTSTKGRDFVGFNLVGKKYFFGIYDADPQILVFETYECPVPEDAVGRTGGVGKVFEEKYRPLGRKWRNELVLDSPEVRFFEVSKEDQLDRIKSFWLECHCSLAKIGIGVD